ncbi:MAG: hypothetical protein CO114_07670, partial [Euryarchaeota archaeon CG_4_9_14_3_um_filter_38_12]
IALAIFGEWEKLLFFPQIQNCRGNFGEQENKSFSCERILRTEGLPPFISQKFCSLWGTHFTRSSCSQKFAWQIFALQGIAKQFLALTEIFQRKISVRAGVA